MTEHLLARDPERQVNVQVSLYSAKSWPIYQSTFMDQAKTIVSNSCLHYSSCMQ
jgi:hypothetical protein